MKFMLLPWYFGFGSDSLIDVSKTSVKLLLLLYLGLGSLLLQFKTLSTNKNVSDIMKVQTQEKKLK